MFAASFDSKMGCLYSVFDVKKQGKPFWVVRVRNWKLRGGENRLSGLLEGVSIASLGKARRQGGSTQNFAFLVSSIDTLSGVSIPKFNTGIWVSVPVREGIGTPCIDTCLQGYRYPLDTPLGIGTKGGYRYPSPPLGLEYRYWHSSTDTSCLKTFFGPP
ncbi:hypothetical protein GQ457_03G019870 [Hibiscus cannabinus]